MLMLIGRVMAMNMSSLDLDFHDRSEALVVGHSHNSLGL